MAQLTTLRQRIKAIETIKKITHAMRLISMSLHTRLRQKEDHLEIYKRSFEKLFSTINKFTTSKIKTQKDKTTNKNLIILLGSQKGLAGAFNNMLFNFFEDQNLKSKLIDFKDTEIITVGKKATEYITAKNYNLKRSFDIFSLSNFIHLAKRLTDIILEENPKSVIVISNQPKSFFIQEPTLVKLLPLDNTDILRDNLSNNLNNNIDNKDKNKKDEESYSFEQDPAILLNKTRKIFITILLQELLFKSLLSEQASRFISMDTSTRNAENALEGMKIVYNKIRQAAITRELTELSTVLA